MQGSKHGLTWKAFLAFSLKNKETKKDLSHDNWFLGKEFSPRIPEYEVGLLPTQQ